MLNDFVRAGAIDELDITISPMMAGSAGSPPTALLPASMPFHLSSVLTQESFLMARYLKEQSPVDTTGLAASGRAACNRP
ncbi:MAG: hypothetical protein R2709_13055 [Marmoricola sp.]